MLVTGADSPRIEVGRVASFLRFAVAITVILSRRAKNGVDNRRATPAMPTGAKAQFFCGPQRGAEAPLFHG